MDKKAVKIFLSFSLITMQNMVAFLILYAEEKFSHLDNANGINSLQSHL